MRANNRERLRRVVTKIEEEGWELVLLSEILVERGGVIWLEDDQNRVVISTKSLYNFFVYFMRSTGTGRRIITEVLLASIFYE